MQILTVDIGTGTQDIFLYDSRLDIENGFKLILPSPTMIVHRRIQQATQRRQPVLLTGTIMGGGPSQWAAENHLRSGLPVYATPQAALSFNDNLAEVQRTGITLVSDEETAHLSGDLARIELRDLDLPAIQTAFAAFGVSLGKLTAVAVAVFDHGNAPAEISDRQFRFDYLDERLRSTRGQFRHPFSAFAFTAGSIPAKMTRLQAVAESYRASSSLAGNAPLLVMDTAPAAILGATFDPQVQQQPRQLIANIGNFHTLAFRLGPAGVEGLFEHHTGLLDPQKLHSLLVGLANSTLQHSEVFNDHGHGALVYDPSPMPLHQGPFDVAITGPRRNLVQPLQWTSESLRPYFAVPFGDMMTAGCIGMLAAAADLLPDLSGPIQASLAGAGSRHSAPWEDS